MSFRSSRERLVSFRALVTKNPGLELPESVVAEYVALKEEVETLGGLLQY